MCGNGAKHETSEASSHGALTGTGEATALREEQEGERNTRKSVREGGRTKATVGGVPPFSLVCLSQSHEWLCTSRMNIV